MSEYKIVILGNTPSLKNSKRIARNKKTGATFIIPSQTHQDWKPEALHALKQSPLVGKSWRYPLEVSFHFIRSTARHFDYINAAQAPCDLLIEAGIIADDDMDHLIPCGFSYQVNKTEPCCILTIRESE